LSVPITEQERALYQWQRDVTDFGDAGQERLKAASVLVSRCGGVGGALAHALAAAVAKAVDAMFGRTRSVVSCFVAPDTSMC